MPIATRHTHTSLASYQSPFYQAWTKGQFQSPIIAFHQCYPGSPDSSNRTCNGNQALQTLGGYNRALVKDHIHWYDIIDKFPLVNSIDFVYTPGVYNYWSASITSFSIGGEEQKLNATYGAAAMFDHASYGRGVPMSVDAYGKLVALAKGVKVSLSTVQAPNNGGGDFYTVDCAAAKTLPPLSYTFAGHPKKWSILAKDYVVDVGNGVCTLNVRTLGSNDFVIGNFGETFARDKYILFDFQKRKVGIADLKW